MANLAQQGRPTGRALVSTLCASRAGAGRRAMGPAPRALGALSNLLGKVRAAGTLPPSELHHRLCMPTPGPHRSQLRAQRRIHELTWQCDLSQAVP